MKSSHGEITKFENLCSRYRCQNGYMFENGDFPFWYNECRPNREWAMPDDIVPCISKSNYVLTT